MATLKSFRRDARAMREGDWVSPGAEFDGLEIRCRFLGFDYADAVALKTRQSARLPGGEDRLTSEQRSRINLDAMIETALLDVRGLQDDTGAPVPFADFIDMLRDPAYGQLATLAFQCCMMVGRQRETDRQDAAGN